MAEAQKQYGGWIQVMDAMSIVVYTVFAVDTTRKIVIGVSGAPIGVFAAIALVALVAYLMADMVSGLVHCAADNFGEEHTVFFGPAFIKPFREHHRDPEGITHHNFFEVNGNSCLVNLFVLVPTYLLVPVASTYWGAIFGAFVLSFTLAIVGTNQFHKWAHLKNPSAFVRFLQSIKLVLTPTTHQVHHTAPFDRYYCITTGWMNPVLERVGLFNWIHHTFDWARPASERGKAYGTGAASPILKSK